MKEKVYLETTIVSYLTAWRSPQLLMASTSTRDTKLVGRTERELSKVDKNDSICFMKYGEDGGLISVA